ncbi:protein Nam8p [Trichomonascus vanleenenianus]|uniref:Nam8p n=1 Tax=Trichomonascus vanleenenianus TaxID=2268995 RepID=UPI003EC9D5AC
MSFSHEGPALSTAPHDSTTAPAAPANGTDNAGTSGSKTTLWMGELDPWLDENAIRKIWSAFGENVTVKLIRDKFTGANAGYCFVDFGSPAAANKALSLNGQPIPNSQRSFKLNWASGGGLNDKREDREPEFSIFVGDLAPDVTEPQLLQVFQARYPACKSAKIMIDPSTNVSRGYGFVRFSDELQMQRALAEMQGFYCGNRPMRISTATPKNKTAAAAAAMVGGLYPQMVPNGPAGNPMAFYGNPQAAMNQFTDPNNTTVFVGGLSGHVSEDELRSYFQGFGDITYVKIPPGKGCGFVQFVQRHSAEAAITQMQGYPIGNSRVRLSWGRSQANSAAAAAAAPAAAAAAYRAAPPPPNVYPQIGIPQPHYGPYGPLNPQAAHVHPTQQQLAPPPPPPPPAPPASMNASVPPNAPPPEVVVQQQPTAPGQDPTEPVPVARLNELYLAARDGRLDRVESDSRGYHGVYAQ